MQKIGTSFSMCVSDIVNGRVNYEDVQFIVTSTRYATRDEMITGVTMVHQRKNASEYIAMATRLWDDGKIYQPTVIETPSREPCPTWIDLNFENTIEDEFCNWINTNNSIISQVNELVVDGKYEAALIAVNQYCQQLQSKAESESTDQWETAYDIIFGRYQPSIASMVYNLEKLSGKPFKYADSDLDYRDDVKAFIHALHVYTNSFDQECSHEKTI